MRRQSFELRAPRLKTAWQKAAGKEQGQRLCAEAERHFTLASTQIRLNPDECCKGRDPSTITSLRDLVEIEALKTGLRFLIARSGGQTTTAIYDFVSALRAVARDHLHVDQARLDLITKIMRRLNLDIGKRGLTKKNRSRLRPLDDPQNAAALLGLPETLIGLVRNPHQGAV